MLARTIADGKRHASRHKRNVARESSPDAIGDNDAELVNRLKADITSPSQCAARNENVDKLMSLISRLPEPQREAITLKFVNGLSVKEIVERMDSTEGAVAGYLRRGMQSIAKMMKPSDDSK